MDVRMCQADGCGKVIPPWCRSTAKTCSDSCRLKRRGDKNAARMRAKHNADEAYREELNKKRLEKYRSDDAYREKLLKSIKASRIERLRKNPDLRLRAQEYRRNYERKKKATDHAYLRSRQEKKSSRRRERVANEPGYQEKIASGYRKWLQSRRSDPAFVVKTKRSRRQNYRRRLALLAECQLLALSHQLKDTP